MTEENKLRDRALDAKSYINGYEDAKADIVEYYELALAKVRKERSIAEIQKDLDDAGERARMIAWGTQQKWRGTAHYLGLLLGLGESFRKDELTVKAFELGALIFEEYSENTDDKWANGDMHFRLKFDLDADKRHCVYKRAIEITGDTIKDIVGGVYDVDEHETMFYTEEFLCGCADTALFNKWSDYGWKHVGEKINAEHYKRLLLALGFTDGICELRQRKDGDAFNKEALLQEIQTFWTLDLGDWLEESSKREMMATLAQGDRDREILTYWGHYGE